MSVYLSDRAPYRSDLPERPLRMRELPIDKRGYPIPWFVYIDPITHDPDFRVIKPGGIMSAHYGKVCWLCGQPLGAFKCFVVGPMCGVNRTTSEPPSHRECSEYAVKACPFLTRPLASRNDRGIPSDAGCAGTMIKRNPGVSLLWITKSYKPFHVHGGVLFKLGDPVDLAFWAKGRTATRDEVDESIRTGLPLLEKEARKDRHPVAAVRELGAMVERFNGLLNRYCPA